MVASTLIKVSILFLYRRLAGSLTNKFVYAVWACMAFCIASFVAFLLAVFFICSPTDRDGCDDEGIVLVTATSVSTVQDLIISFLPVFLIRNLQMPRRQKLALGGIFGLGLLTTVCGIMRTYYLITVYYCKSSHEILHKMLTRKRYLRCHLVRILWLDLDCY